MTASVWLLGTDADVVAFRLVGVQGAICSSRREIERGFAAVDRAAPEPALVLVSGAVAALAPEIIAERSERVHGPIVVVLP